MIRKILPFLLAAGLVCSLTGCMGRDDNTSSTVSQTARPKPTASPEVSALPDASEEPESDLPGSGSSGSSAENSSAGSSLSENDQDMGSFGPFRDALKGVYGDKYYPDTRLTDEEVRTELGMDDTLYEEVYAERSGETGRPDTFIAVKAKSGKAEEVKEKLTAYKRKLSQDENFTDAAHRIDAAQIYAEGDYVFFLLAGEAEKAEGDTSEGVAEKLGKEVQRGIDAIREALGMM